LTLLLGADWAHGADVVVVAMISRALTQEASEQAEAGMQLPCQPLLVGPGARSDAERFGRSDKWAAQPVSLRERGNLC
jgi:hypothetical protein